MERKSRRNKVFWRVFPASSSLVGRIGPRILSFSDEPLSFFSIIFFVNTLLI